MFGNCMVTICYFEFRMLSTNQKFLEFKAVLDFPYIYF